MRFHAPAPAKKARIEIIPLIDVIFFLLATFVLVSLSMTRLQGIDFEMPVAQAAQPGAERPETITVAVLAGGGYVWQRQGVTFDQLVAKLTQYRRESPDPRVLINGEENAEFGRAVHILDTARKIGIEKVSIQTKLQPISID
jgi:biopolymer transport protein ExbD